MSRYQFIQVDERHSVITTEEILALDDGDATQTALARLERHDIEIWKDGIRLKTLFVHQSAHGQLRDAVGAALKFNPGPFTRYRKF